MSTLKADAGNTLANLVITIAIISTLLLTITPSFTPAIKKAKGVACKIDWHAVHVAASMRALDRQGEAAASGWNDLVPDYLTQRVPCPHGGRWVFKNGELMCGKENKF